MSVCVLEDHFARRGDMASSCSTHEPDPSQPPRVAHCVAGLVRSFTEPLVYKSLRRNLIESFGGEPSLFLALKTFDVPSKDKKGHFNITVATDVSVDWTPERIEQQLRPAIEWLKPTVVRLRNSSDETPEALINLACPTASPSEVKRHPHHLIYATEAGMVRLVGQMKTNAECLRLIEEYEERHGVCFDWVSRSRPDLLHIGGGGGRGGGGGGGGGGTVPRYNHTQFFAPNNRTRDDVYMDTRDWFLLTRRRNARGALDVLELYRRCNRSRADLKTPEAWLRASIRSEGAHYRTLNLAVALAHPESCAEVCPQKARLEATGASASSAATAASATSATAAFRVRKEGCSVATPEACVDDVPVTCRNPGCSQALARLVGERRAEESARQAAEARLKGRGACCEGFG